MTHVKAVSANHPKPADDLSTLYSLIQLLRAVQGLNENVRSVFGIGAYLEKKTSAS